MEQDLVIHYDDEFTAIRTKQFLNLH
jgi:hypothetical protein